MAKNNNNFPKLFKVALSAAGISMSEFARMHGVSQQAISRIIYGQSKSKRLQTTLDQFVRDQFAALKIQYQKAA